MLARKRSSLIHSSVAAQCKSPLVGKQKKVEEKENGKKKNHSGTAVTQKEEGKLAHYIEIVEETVL